MVGGKTFRADDPLLTARVPGARNPKRVVLTSDLARARESRLLRAGAREAIFVCPRGVPRAGVERLRDA